MGHLVHGPDREGRALTESLGERAGLGEERVPGDDPQREADLERALGIVEQSIEEAARS